MHLRIPSGRDGKTALSRAQVDQTCEKIFLNLKKFITWSILKLSKICLVDLFRSLKQSFLKEE